MGRANRGRVGLVRVITASGGGGGKKPPARTTKRQTLVLSQPPLVNDPAELFLRQLERERGTK